MRTVARLGEDNELFVVQDPDACNEATFEVAVVEALTTVYRRYRCIKFTGTFEFDGGRHRPDLALVAEDFSHWFVIEVELIAHSLQDHVLPQVRAFCYGDPEPDCASAMARDLGIDLGRAETLIKYVPRAVVVVANRWGEHWLPVLRSHGVQMLVVTRFQATSGARALEVDGALQVFAENLGFGRYSAADRSLIFAQTTRIPRGLVQLEDEGGALASWQAVESGTQLWVTKEFGEPAIPDGAYARVLRAIDGKLALRLMRS